MAETQDNSLTAIVNIAADGDVILVVGPEKIRFCVYLLILKAALKLFSAMLGSNGKEGCDLHKNGFVDLLLPEDNVMVMECVCAIIHHQNKMLLDMMALYEILEVAITVDKYDFVDALKFVSECWLQSRNAIAKELMILTATVYVFKNAQAFKELTKALILNYGGSYLSLSTEKIESVMSWKVFCKIFGEFSLLNSMIH